MPTYTDIEATPEEVQALIDKIKATPEEIRKSGPLKSGGIGSSDPTIRPIRLKDVDATIVEIGGQQFPKWRCNATDLSTLTVNGTPLEVTKLLWCYGIIAWKAGSHIPIFEVPCPRDAGEGGEIQLRLGARVFKNCDIDAVSLSEGIYATTIKCKVNDAPHQYGDNTGFFEIIVKAFS